MKVIKVQHVYFFYMKVVTDASLKTKAVAHHHQFLMPAIWRRWVRIYDLHCPRSFVKFIAPLSVSPNRQHTTVLYVFIYQILGNNSKTLGNSKVHKEHLQTPNWQHRPVLYTSIYITDNDYLPDCFKQTSTPQIIVRSQLNILLFISGV